jgi:hypothetical protein
MSTGTGMATLAAGLGIDLLGGFRLMAGDSFDLIVSNGLLSGGFDSLSVDGAACSARFGDIWRCGNVGFNLDLSIGSGPPGSVDVTVSGVPEPSTGGMLVAGFLGLGALAPRRRRQALAG